MRNPHTAVLTGAAGSICGRVAADLLDAGWRVVGIDVREGADDRVDWRIADVTAPASLSAVAQDVGPVRFLVNGAGFGSRANAEVMTEEQWSSVVATCLSGTFFTAQAFHPNLKAAGGATIVNIASAAANNAIERYASYCAAKAGVVALTGVLGLEWAKDGIRVVSVSPGYIATPRQREGQKLDPNRFDTLTSRTPLGRLGTVEEIAAAIIALEGDAFGFMTGTNVLIDGGWTTDGGGAGLWAEGV